VGAVSPSPSELTNVFGREIPLAHGEYAAEYRAVTESVALLPAPWEVSLSVRGRDAGAFLQNLLTQDILSLDDGASVPAALASRKGHLEADLRVARFGDGFRIRLQRRLVDSFIETLDRYRIVEDVAWETDPEPSVSYLLVGPKAITTLERLVKEAQATAEAATNESSTALEQAQSGFAPQFGDGAHWMTVSEVTAEDVFVSIPAGSAASFQSWTGEQGVPMTGWKAFDVARIRAGRAWFGIDADEARLVPEPGFADRISYEKGCYLGQETIARLHYRGKLNWKLESLRFDANSPTGPSAAPGADLLSDGNRVGWLTSTAVTPDGTGVALGYLHRKARESGGALTLASGLLLSPVSPGSTLTCHVDSTNLDNDS